MTNFKVALIVFAALPLASCAVAPSAAPEQTQSVVVFPGPPDQARFFFERTITGSADIEQPDSETRWRRILTGEATITRTLSKPFDVEACQGRIYVSDSVSRSVLAFDVPTGEFMQIGTSQPGHLRKPLGLAVDGQCNLYVADQTDRRVVIYDRDGTFIKAIGGKNDFDRL